MKENKAMIIGTISLIFTWIGIHTVILALLYQLDSTKILLETNPTLIKALALILSFSGLALFLNSMQGMGDE